MRLIMPAPKITRRKLPGGDAGTRATLGEMARLINEGARDWSVIQAARAVAADVPPTDHRGRISALFCWVRDKVRFTRDPVGVELLVGAPQMIADISERGETEGDCDEKTTLLGAMLKAVGYPVQLVAAKTRPVRGLFGSVVWTYSHVYLEARVPGVGNIRLDPTRMEAQVGQEVPSVGELVYPVENAKKKEFQPCATN